MVNMNSVFISYSSKDIEMVSRIVEELDLMGVPYWKAPEMIPAGSSYAREIPQAIQSCNVFLLVLSPFSQASIWVEKEIDNAICNRKTIIPFKIREVELNDTFRFYLNNVQMISYPENHQRAFDELKKQFMQIMPELSEAESAMDQTPQQEKSVSVRSVVRQKEESGEPRVLKTVSQPRNTRGSDHHQKSNALRMNRIPLACEYCGCKELKNTSMGVYSCARCGKDNYDDFETIRNYLERVGNASAVVIERDTGVPRRIIEYFFRDEYLEIPKNIPIRLSCEKCGAPIRTGTLCDNCKAGAAETVKKDRRGAWHSHW
ncbi:MAG: TIR domain-containing protein [Clostridium sp.]|nr:TIR domain-containing protein [Clostridium sp.]